MRVLIDGRMYQGRMHGLARYVYATLQEMAVMQPEWEFGVLQLENHFAALAARHANITPVTVKSPPFTLGEHFELPKVIEKWTPAVFHAPTIAVPASIPGRYVVTVPDLTKYHYPTRGFEKLYFQWLLKPVLRKARRLLVYSQHTAHDVHDCLGIALEKISVSILGVGDELAEPLVASQREQLLQELKIAGPYILAVANPRPHKNLTGLLKAWEALQKRPEFTEQYGDWQLVIVSAPSPELEAQVAGLSRVRRLGGVSDLQLAALYQAANIFVMPSIYEGFGLPLAEAMKSAVPCLSARAASLPEVGLEACAYFDPYSDSDLEQQLWRLLNDPNECQRLAAQGLERSRSFSWKTAAEVHLQAYRQAVEAKY